MDEMLFRLTIAAAVIPASCFGLFLPAASAAANDQPALVQVHQDFSHDPGWDSINNRVEASNPPTVNQDFGWSAGKIGGTIWSSTTPAWYGMPLDRPLSFKDAYSASGKIAVMPVPGSPGAAYLGWFNHERQGWRPWSSMAMRVEWEPGDENRPATASLFIDSMSGEWAASGIAEIPMNFPADGSWHSWRFSYDPDAVRPAWTDTHLRSCLSANPRRHEVEPLLAAMQKLEPQLTRQALMQRLHAGLEQGQVSWLHRHGKDFWILKQPHADLKGKTTLQVDDGPKYDTYLDRNVHDQPVSLDRFGIFNMQLYHRVCRFFVSDLVVDGRKIDLANDPGWESHGNRAQFVERDFERQDFGYSPDTHHAGGQKGEIGGQLYNVEPVDPHHGYYADTIGTLTLDDPIHFSGNISFIEGSTDAGMFFGYFRAADERVEHGPNAPGGASAWPQPNVLGIVVDGPARVGWWFSPWCTAAKPDLSVNKEGPVFLPTGASRTFDFKYDPKANHGIGQITVTLEGAKPVICDLTPEQRKAGASFDHFGLMSFRRGGKYSTLYFDDLTYTARRPPNYQPIFHEQKVVTVPYPKGGRKY